jgi:dolichol-phosphate mannosyltransferase
MSVELSVIIPLYKEEGNITPFLKRLLPTLNTLNISYEILFCLDPSPDHSETIIRKAQTIYPQIKLILMSRRFGQPAATLAGLTLCNGNKAVVIDIDLQDPPELIPDLYYKLNQNFEVVYAKRRTRNGETWMKKLIANLGYRLINKCSEVPIPKNTGDFRIMTRRVIEEIKKLNESHGFLRGLVAYVGFPQTFIEYDRDIRYTGKGHYNRYTGSIKIGLNGLISFSSKPLQIMSVVGATFAAFSFLLGGWYVLQKLLGFELSPGLPTTVLVVTFFSGIQLLCLGLMGEYIGRIYDEVKRRPHFIVDKIIESPTQCNRTN